MKPANINNPQEWFEVLQTSKHVQTAMMTLQPNSSTGEKAEAHASSDQVLLMLEGELAGEVGAETVSLKKGDVIIIPAGIKHRFENRSAQPAVTFNVYSPPEYPADTKG